MSEQDKNEKQERKPLDSCEHKSDRRTTAFVARRLDEVQNQLCDMINELRTFEHYSEIEDVGFCLMVIQRLKKKYRHFAENGTWPEPK